MNTILIKNGELINEGKRFQADIYIENGKIAEISTSGITKNADQIIDAANHWIFPGVIDDQVHFREPGLTHKATINSEARAAVAGGVTSFMEMPNTIPQATTQIELQKKYDIAAATSPANYSFFMGGTNDNVDEILRTNAKEVCGIKLFMGSSTGNMLVDNEVTLRSIFSKTPMLIATHCEDEHIIKQNEAQFKREYGPDIPWHLHPKIRSREACYKSSKLATDLAKEYNSRLHVLHISTEEELALFSNQLPIEQKKITAEVCVHHLSFNDSHYATKQSLIKCNPAIKTISDQYALWEALNNDVLDIVATDHAPHTWDEKMNKYFNAPSGLPLVQHSLQIMLEHAADGKITVEKLVDKMCHKPAILFNIDMRGFLRENYWADIVIINPNTQYEVNPENILYKCGWSPFTGRTFSHSITHTIVSGNLVWSNGTFVSSKSGMRLSFGI